MKNRYVNYVNNKINIYQKHLTKGVKYELDYKYRKRKYGLYDS